MCCGRDNISPSRAQSNAASLGAQVGDSVATFAWEWRSVNGTDKQRFDSETEARTHINSGNPGTLTVVAI
jgi:hypothetical protein